MRHPAKAIIQLMFRIIICPLVLLYKLFSFSRPNDSLFRTLGQFLALFPGKTGSFLRVAFYSSILPTVSPDIHLDFGTYLAHPDVSIGKGVVFGAYCIVGKCIIGKGTFIGSCTNILSGNRQHNFKNPGKTFQEQGGEFIRIYLGENCWIGTNSVLMTNIGNHCIIGAGSVVVKEIPSNVIAVGNPCRVIKGN